MARPRLSDGPTQRLHIMISADEIAAINGWRAAHGVRSLSQAVRELCWIGIFSDSIDAPEPESAPFDEQGWDSQHMQQLTPTPAHTTGE